MTQDVFVPPVPPGTQLPKPRIARTHVALSLGYAGPRSLRRADR